jgi:hypothetical protein
MDVQPGSQTRSVDLSGTPDQISRAEQLINDVLAEVFLVLPVKHNLHVVLHPSDQHTFHVPSAG